MSFSSLGLSAELLRAVADQGYREPTAVQRHAIPIVLAGRDLQAAAQTGTGKTAAFTLPLLEKLRSHPARTARPGPVRALVLTPTRELAAQVGESVRDYGRYLTTITASVIFGGVNINPQIERLQRGSDIVIATPGRLLDHLRQKTIDLSQVETLVLDEADRMLDMGFIRDIRRILGLLPRRRQNLLFSATFSDDIRKLAAGLLNHPEIIDVTPRNLPVASISQRVYAVDKNHKRALLTHLIQSEAWGQVLVFTRTKHGANRLCEQLQGDGIRSAVIHGNKSQGARTRALADFKHNQVQVLVATDIAARGLDIDRLPHVVNYELPNIAEDYVHRIGRTGRAGDSGDAVSLVSGEERSLLQGIERMLRRELPRVTADAFKPDPRALPKPGSDVHPMPHAHSPSRGGAHRRPGKTPRGGRSRWHQTD